MTKCYIWIKMPHCPKVSLIYHCFSFNVLSLSLFSNCQKVDWVQTWEVSRWWETQNGWQDNRVDHYTFDAIHLKLSGKGVNYLLGPPEEDNCGGACLRGHAQSEADSLISAGFWAAWLPKVLIWQVKKDSFGISEWTGGWRAHKILQTHWNEYDDWLGGGSRATEDIWGCSFEATRGTSGTCIAVAVNGATGWINGRASLNEGTDRDRENVRWNQLHRFLSWCGHGGPRSKRVLIRLKSSSKAMILIVLILNINKKLGSSYFKLLNSLLYVIVLDGPTSTTNLVPLDQVLRRKVFPVGALPLH